MKKFLCWVAIGLVIAAIFAGCARRGRMGGDGEPKEEPKEELKVSDYFPIDDNLYWEYEGVGNEFAGGRVDTEFIEGNKVQLAQNNGGTVVAKVFEVTDEGVKLLNSFEESYFRINYLGAEPSSEKYLLKAPLKEKNSWQEEGTTWTIESLSEKVEVPAGEFTCIKVVGKSGESVVERYFAKGVGLVKQKFIQGDVVVEENLAKFGDAEKDDSLPEKVLTIYYPSKDADKLLEDKVTEKFRTGDALIDRITSLLKDEKYKVLSQNARLLNFSREEGVLRLNFSKELVTEMNAGSGYEALLLSSIVKTYGENLGSSGVILNVEGKGYESGHFVFGKDEVLKVDE